LLASNYFVAFPSNSFSQTLVRGVFTNAHESIHHTDWPEVNTAIINEKLLSEMSLARRVASLGLSARSNANLKVHQPLAKVLVHVSQGKAELSAELIKIVADELNVKALEFVKDADALVSYKVLPNNKLLGPKFGADFPNVTAALKTMDPAQLAGRIASGEDITFELNGDTVTLTGDEILINTDAAENMTVAADKVVNVGIDTVITPELKAERLAREIVRRIQTQRKNYESIPFQEPLDLFELCGNLHAIVSPFLLLLAGYHVNSPPA